MLRLSLNSWQVHSHSSKEGPGVHIADAAFVRHANDRCTNDKVGW